MKCAAHNRTQVLKKCLCLVRPISLFMEILNAILLTESHIFYRSQNQLTTGKNNLPKTKIEPKCRRIFFLCIFRIKDV